jgi:glycosyltransferase involved in cell wall biosynthesis
MTNLRVAYFSHDSILEGVGRSQILALCNSLVRSNVDVSLFSFEKITPAKSFIEETKENGLIWTAFDFYSDNPFKPVGRIKSLRDVDGDYQLIHARGDLPAFAGVLRKREPVLWDIRSLWAEQRHILNPRKFNPLVMSGLNRICKYNSNHAAGYNTLTRAINPYLRDKYPSLPNISSVISTCVDTDFFAFADSFPSYHQGLLSGTYNEIYNSSLIAKFSNYMKSRFQHRIVWAMGQESSQKPQVMGEDLSYCLTYDQMPSIIAESSYGIAVCKNDLGPSLAAAMPTKIAEFLSVGRPVVLNSSLGDVKTELIDANVGVTLNDESDIPSAARKLLTLLEDETTPKRCRVVAENIFSLKYATQTYIEIYKKILNHPLANQKALH